MEFTSVVLLMGMFYLLIFALSYVENVLEQRRARNLAQDHLSSGCPAPNYKSRTPSPNEMPYYDAAGHRRNDPTTARDSICSPCREPSSPLITRLVIDKNPPVSDEQSSWVPSEQQTFECYARGNQWICTPAENSKGDDQWSDSHESLPTCVHGQDKDEFLRLRQKSKDGTNEVESNPSHQYLNSLPEAPR